MTCGICVTDEPLTLDEVLVVDIADREVWDVVATVIVPIVELDEEERAPEDGDEELVGLTEVKVSVIGDITLDAVEGMTRAVVLVTRGKSREADAEDVVLELKVVPEAVVCDIVATPVAALAEDSEELAGLELLELVKLDELDELDELEELDELDELVGLVELEGNADVKPAAESGVA